MTTKNDARYDSLQATHITFEAPAIADADKPRAGQLTPPEWFTAPRDSNMTDQQWKRLCDQFRYEFDKDGDIVLFYKGRITGVMSLKEQVEMAESAMRIYLEVNKPSGHRIMDWGDLRPYRGGYRMRVIFKDATPNGVYAHEYNVSRYALSVLALGTIPDKFAFTSPSSRNVQKAFANNQVLRHDIKNGEYRRAARVVLRRALNYLFWKQFNSEPQRTGKEDNSTSQKNEQSYKKQKPASAGFGGEGLKTPLLHQERTAIRSEKSHQISHSVAQV